MAVQSPPIPESAESTPRPAPAEAEPPKSRYLFFPGWTMLGIAAAAQFMSAPGQSYSVAAFKGPMREGLGISETDYSLAYGFATLISGLSVPFIGRLVDRVGARRLLPIIAIFLGCACFWMSRMRTLSGVYVGFSLIRCLGQGALTLIAAWMVGEWFERRRGLAIGIAGLGSGLSVMVFPLMNAALISRFGWPFAWGFLAVMVWIVLVLPTIVFARDRPEDLGLHPDGIAPKAKDERSADRDANVGSTSGEIGALKTHECWTVGEVLRDRSFWKLLSVPATSGMVGTGLIFHQVGLLGSRGIEPTWALGLISFQAVVAALASLLAGWLTDRIDSRYLLVAAMLFLASALGLVLMMSSPRFAIVYAILLGLHGSILRSTGTVIWINYYGRTHQGAVRGVAFSVMIFAAAFGPFPMALSIDLFGSWDPALVCFLAFPLAAACLVRSAHRPVRKPRSAASAA